jgi:hypothetical protein
MADTDADGNRLHSSGSWSGSSHLSVQGGQAMHFQISNLNVLGTTITIRADRTGESKSQLILPQSSADISFTVFGAEPMGWNFDTSTNSDAFIVSWNLFSSWLPGDPPNG